MITIQITNTEEIVEAKKGWLVAHVVGAFVDMHAEVEAIVMERIRTSLHSEGITAVVQQVREP